MRQENRNIASDLLESTITVIARDGFDKASTRNIAGECGIADAYIYVHFKDKGDLFAKAFQKADMELAGEFRKHLPILNQRGMTNENRLFFLLSNVWMYLTACPDACRFFVQYYYSPYYRKYSAQDHSALWTPVLEKLKVLFRPDTDVEATLWPVLNTMLGQAIRAVADASSDRDVIAQDNYKLILGMVHACLSDN